jgi:hypothetical protein
MRHTPIRRLPFDPSGNFVYLKAMKVNGVDVKAGDPVDKSAFSDRRLRQLYAAGKDGRPEGTGQITYAAGSKPTPKPRVKPLAVGPSDMSRYDQAGPPETKKKGIRRFISTNVAA